MRVSVDQKELSDSFPSVFKMIPRFCLIGLNSWGTSHRYSPRVHNHLIVGGLFQWYHLLIASLRFLKGSLGAENRPIPTHLLGNIRQIENYKKQPGKSFMIFLGWLSDPFKWLSDLQWSGIKRSPLESPGDSCKDNHEKEQINWFDTWFYYSNIR